MSVPRLVLLLVAGAAVVHGQADVALFEAPPAEAVERGKQALDKWSAQAATERGLVNVLLGNSCFTTAIAALNRECGQLTNEQRCWLALQFSMCFQRASGFKVLDCPSVCPRRRSLQSCVEECTGRMDDRQQMTYTQFFGDVLNMCLFLQTQNFQQVTAALVTDMHASSAAANASLSAIRTDLHSQAQSLAQSLTALAQLQAVQSEVQAGVQAGLQEVQAVGRAAQGLQHSMDKSLNMTGVLSSRHEQLMQGFTELESAHQAHAARAKQAFEQLAQEAAALEHRQARYEALQTRLLNASESLLDQSQDMNDLLKLLMHYQARGNTLLAQLQGSSVSLHDVLFYTLALCVPLVFITYPSDVRILLLAGVLACWGVERAVLQHLVMLFGPAGGLGSSSSSYGAVHDAKVAVRLVVLGGTLGVVVWLLLKRRAAHNRREAIFQAIQQTLQEAQYHQAVAYQPAAAAHGPNLAGHAGPQAQVLVPFAAPQGRRPAANKTAPATALAAPASASQAAMLAAQHAQLHPGVLHHAVSQPHQAIKGPSLQVPDTPLVPEGSRGWLGLGLLGANHLHNRPPAPLPEQLVGWLQHPTGPAAAAAGCAPQQQLLLQPQQQPAAAQQYAVIPTQHQQHQGQQQHPQLQHTLQDLAAAQEGSEESLGTGAGHTAAAAARQRRGSRHSTGDRAPAGSKKAAAAAGRKRSAAVAADAGVVAAAHGSGMEGSDAAEGPAGATSKQGLPKRKRKTP